jgi:predicted nucleotidyltransferase
VTTREPLDVGRVVTTLARHGVRYVVVGGIPAIRAADIDVLGAFDADNFARLGAALGVLDASGEGWDGDPDTLGSAMAWSLDTAAGPVDLLFVLEPWGTYDELRASAVEIAGFGVTIPIVSLDDLIALKEALGRPKDLRVAVELEELRRRRDG